MIADSVAILMQRSPKALDHRWDIEPTYTHLG